MAIEPGQMLLQYRLIGQIGQGGMGVVWKALDTSLNRHVAIKFLPADLVGAAPDRQARFLREAQAAAALDHPGIAVIHEVGDHDDQPFIVMQYLEGQTLGDRIRQDRLSVQEWLRIASAIAEALVHAHNHGIIHRDLKPDNVMITTEGQVKLLDFGLAKLLEPERSPGDNTAGSETQMETFTRDLTRAGKVLGTVAYMSPEQARGESVDHRSDLFSFGVMLYQMACGQLPFARGSEIESLHATLKEEPLPLAGLAREIPAEIERLVRKLMEKERQRRYQDAAEVATDLSNLQRDLDSGTAAVISGATAVATARKSRGIGFTAIVSVAVVVAALLALWWGFPRDEPAPQTNEPAGAVAVIGFEVLDDPSDSDNLSRMLMGLITTDLAESGGLAVVSTPKVLSAAREVRGGESFDISMAEQAARMAGAGVMIVGQIGRSTRGMLLTAEWVDVASGRSIGSHSQTVATKDDFFALAEAVAAAAREDLGAAPTRPAFDLDGALTNSAEAYEYYALGQIALNGFDFDAAVIAYEQAIAIDPSFALAYLRAGIALSWFRQDERGVTVLESGLPHLDRLPQRWRTVYRAVIHWEQGRFDETYDLLSRLVDEAADIPDAYYLLGELMIHIPKYEDIRRSRQLFERALDIDPSFKIVFFHLVDAYILGQDLGAAKRLVNRYLAEDPDDPAARAAEMVIAGNEGRLDEAVALGEALLGENVPTATSRLSLILEGLGDYERAYEILDASPQRDVPVFLYSRAAALVGMGRVDEGLAAYSRSAELMADTPNGHLAADAETARAQLLLFKGDGEAAVAAARRAIEIEPLKASSHYILGVVQLRLGDIAAAKQTLGEQQQALRQCLGQGGVFWEILLTAEIAIAEEEIAKAREVLDRARTLPHEARYAVEEQAVLARLEAAAGNPEGAVAAMRAALDPRHVVLWLQISLRPILYLELAELEERAGQRDAAVASYREFLRRWGKAGDAFPAIESARQRIAALEAAPL